MSATMWRNWVTHTLLMGMHSDTSILENCLIAFLKKNTNILLTYDPENVLLGIYPTEMKIYVHTQIYT